MSGSPAPVTGSSTDRYRAVARNPPATALLRPVSFKRYPGSRRYPLPWHPVTRPARDQLELLAGLFRPYAPTRVHYTSVAAALSLVGAGYRADPDPWWYELQVAGIRRAAPSGGGFYPVELYAAVPGAARLPAGVYHYDPLGHAIERIRAGNPGPLLERAIPGSGAPAGALLLAARSWKSAGKYGNLCYHLAALDVGVVLGEVLSRPPVPIRVSFFFLDHLLDGLLGVVPEVETVYAAVLLDRLAPAGAECPAGRDRPVGGPSPQATGLDQDLRYRSMVDPVVVELDTASRITDPSRLPPTPVVIGPSTPEPGTAVRLPDPIPAPEPDPAGRRSAVAFQPRPVRLDQLATVLAETTRGYPSDVAGTADRAAPIALYWVMSGVAGLADGGYRYLPAAHAADLRRSIPPGPALQSAITGLDPQLVSASLSLFLVGGYGPGTAAAGERWYRVANLLAGVMLARICRTATALGLGSRPNLGFHPGTVSSLLGLPAGQAPLVHVMIGYPAPRPGCVDLWLPDPGR